MPVEKGKGTHPERTFKRMMEPKILNKNAKGLCFRCDGKFSLGHHCKDRRLQVLIVCDDDGDVVEKEEGSKEEAVHHHLDVVEVSLNLIVDFTPYHTMKLKGDIQGQSVVVLIDSGATYNFISNQVI